MSGGSQIASVSADMVVIALTIAAIGCLAGAMYLVALVVLSVSRKITPIRRTSSSRRTSSAAKVTAVLGPDGRDSGQTVIGPPDSI